ncbi:HNH endonuclease family protein [Pedobacter frigoris]|uniref:HNH endonuclease n=1 Tax=Pedobacter frigoris TaxID=2571272 RepID=A0A4U1CEL5_9SPHI|nr:hypothetical protein [Pedobacter frigoris]TKC04863.1 hypothetical protein FA047_13900 [Pedobacter frigoris]
MRYIDLNKLQPPEGWIDKANLLKAKMQNAQNSQERIKILKENPIWQELLIPLSELSNGKCWYSEAREIMSDRDVDHFRPKNEALNEDDSKRDGYWWLAYDHENFRLSSTYSNQKRRDKYRNKTKIGGKGSYFPLFVGSAIAINKGRLADEDIMLLDPTDPDDPNLITFDDTGKVLANTTNPKEMERVRVSIWLYNLNHLPLEEERARIYKRCQTLINRIDNIKNKADFGASDKTLLKSLKNELRELLSADQELSAVAIASCENAQLGYLARS